MATLMEPIRNHTKPLSHPSVRRRMVRAKLVLDQPEAVIDSVAAMVKALNNGAKLPGSTSHECFPRPRLIQYEMMEIPTKLTIFFG